METNNHKIVDYDAVLDAKVGKEGTPERRAAEDRTNAFFTEQINPTSPALRTRKVF